VRDVSIRKVMLHVSIRKVMLVNNVIVTWI